ncbi:alpha/beta hydrolase [Saccharopolyspora rhizosphaerae]|uniref:Alpha/beta hydrolase n=1 Tax=Saccharopolyspora rhizosphaerae TaxID=2492662 RepID=A0A3R8P831_9PSEU|nr:alpha/beta hydrolase [Saccharopolyspora rhizosphaerae]RRO18707.1 alpha/beta hydrolase [Saccharopolyspora rhizosphaerae]
MVATPLSTPQDVVRTRFQQVVGRLRDALPGSPLRSAAGAPDLPRHAPDALPDGDAVTGSASTVPVNAADGVRLHTEVDGDPDAPVTVVLCHGYLADSAMWLFLRSALGTGARVVSYDHRGHGRSAVGTRARLDLGQLGDDLAAVLDQAAPTGPVVLVGHSMGGMAIMSLAEQRPELFGERVVGVGLVTTAASPVNGRAVLPPETANLVLAAIDRLRLTQVSCHAIRHAARLVARSFAFASRVPPSLVDFLLQLTRPNPVHALVSLIPQFLTLDKRAALPVLGQADTLVVGAEHDQTIEPRHSEAIADAVPNARLAMVPKAGHMVPLEHPAVLGELLQGLITRATTRLATA